MFLCYRRLTAISVPADHELAPLFGFGQEVPRTPCSLLEHSFSPFLVGGGGVKPRGLLEQQGSAQRESGHGRRSRHRLLPPPDRTDRRSAAALLCLCRPASKAGLGLLDPLSDLSFHWPSSTETRGINLLIASFWKASHLQPNFQSALQDTRRSDEQMLRSWSGP